MRDILDSTYPEEFFLLSRQIKARHVDDLLAQTAIATQPHKNTEDAKEWVDGLLSQRRFFRGDEPVAETLDVAGFEAFRKMSQEQSKLIRAK